MRLPLVLIIKGDTQIDLTHANPDKECCLLWLSYGSACQDILLPFTPIQRLQLAQTNTAAYLNYSMPNNGTKESIETGT